MDVNGNKVQKKKKSSRRANIKKRSKKSRQTPVSKTFKLAESPFTFKGKINASTKEVYAVKFNRFVANRHILAVAREKRVDVFECLSDMPFKLLKSFEDVNDYFYALDWSYNQLDASPILAAGGELGVIRVINATRGVEIGYFRIPGVINDLKFHPVHPSVLASASDDHSIRLWNTSSSVCISVFSGSLNRSQVLSIDFSPDGKFLMSGGMDRMLMIWKIQEDDIMSSHNYKPNKEVSFPTKRVYHADFSTGDLHPNFIDSVIWHGENLFISRSADSDIVQWQSGERDHLDLESDIVDCWRYLRESDEMDIFFIRMELDRSKRFLACGTTDGEINIWDFKDACQFHLVHNAMSGIVRMVTFSNDNGIMCACTSQGKIVRFDMEKKEIKQQIEDHEIDDEDHRDDIE